MRDLRIGIVIIGDELLSGKRSDTHLPFVVQALTQRGLELSWARMVGDDRALLVQTFRETQADGAVVFSFGGIGATPDDMTRQCSAEAFGLPLERHAEGARILEEQFGDKAYPLRIRMVEYPAGSELIPNPVNRVPGYSINGHHFVPGFPDMSHPMVEWVLDNHYSQHCHRSEVIEVRYHVLNTPESELIGIMERLLEAYSSVKISCLPNALHRGALIDLGIKGDPESVVAAEEAFLAYLSQQNIEHRRLDESQSKK